MEKIATEIDGLDEILSGGIPKQHTILLSGGPGTGKTTLGMQILFNGAVNHDEHGLYLADTESTTSLKRNIVSFSFYERSAFADERIHISDVRSLNTLLGNTNDPEDLLNRIIELVKTHNISRFVLDSISALQNDFEDEAAFRTFIFRLGEELGSLDCTTFLIVEAASPSERFTTIDYIADGIINLTLESGEQSLVRNLTVRKMRGISYRTGKVSYTIDETGITVFPKIPIERSRTHIDLEKRLSTGIASLDDHMGGGIARGQAVLLAGNTGAGKTTFGLHFLEEGLQNGEKTVFVNLEQSITSLLATADRYGLDIREGYEKGNLVFITPDLIDMQQDKVMYNIMDTVDSLEADRLFFDSLSSIMSGSNDRDAVREMLLQLLSSLKQRNITTMMTYLSEEVFNNAGNKLLGQMKASNLRLSSLTDTIILLRYVEHNQEVLKALNILKHRSSSHSRAIHRYEITDTGIEVGDRFDDM